MENKDILKDYVCLMPFVYTDVQQASQFVCCPSWCFKSLRVNKEGEEEDWSEYFDTTADVMRNWTSTPAYEIRDRKSTRLNSSHVSESRMPSSA